jgi:hypothetical protein
VRGGEGQHPVDPMTPASDHTTEQPTAPSAYEPVRAQAVVWADVLPGVPKLFADAVGSHLNPALAARPTAVRHGG